MRAASLVAVLGFALCPVSGSVQGSERSSGGFLNGNDLSGWEGLINDYWSYKHGAIVGLTPQGLGFNTFLCSKRKYGDFELKFQVWLTGKNANSGVQIR